MLHQGGCLCVFEGGMRVGGRGADGGPESGRCAPRTRRLAACLILSLGACAPFQKDAQHNEDGPKTATDRCVEEREKGNVVVSKVEQQTKQRHWSIEGPAFCVCVCVWNKRRPTVGTPRTPSFSPNFPTLAATTTPESSIGSSFRISIVSSQQPHNGSGGRAFNFTDPFDQSPCWINMGCGWSVYRVSASYHHWSRGRNFGKREGRPKSLGNRHGAATTGGGFSSSSTKCRPSVVSCVC